jgi:hypothetical protein
MPGGWQQMPVSGIDKKPNTDNKIKDLPDTLNNIHPGDKYKVALNV